MLLSSEKIKNILVINLAFIGDVLLATPVTRGLRESYPDAHIVMMTIPLTAPIASCNPFVDEVIIYDKKNQHKKLVNLWCLLKEVRHKKFDLAVCMNFAVRGAMMAWASGIRYRIGYDTQHAGIFLTHKSSHKRNGIQHETENHLQVLRPLEIMTKDTSLDLHIDQTIIDSVIEKLNRSKSKPLGLICPIGSYSLKSWPMDHYADIIRRLNDKIDFYLIGGKGEKPLLEQIQKQSGIRTEQVLAGNLTLPELAGLIKLADVLITVDTGPLHMAQAVGTPVIALFGPTDPTIWGPRNEHDIIFYENKECSPCWGKTECSDNQCMKSIERQAVIDAVLKII